jgi:hypothetical protein
MLGRFYFLTKPVDEDILIDCLNLAVQRYLSGPGN